MKVSEIFLSLQGEGTDMGLPTVFLRLTGCNLRCSYCDTEYAFHDGKEMSDSEIIDKISEFNCNRVCITGGEPLLQDIYPLCKVLKFKGFHIKLETNGSIPLKCKYIDIIDMDIKTPSSGESERMRFSNIKRLRKRDELKFVISDRNDYEYSKDIIERFEPKCNVIFQPSYNVLSLRDLAEWIIADRMDVKLGIQLQKLLWGERRGV
jgi:7-carboxy-7-deazaguanine synthase